MQKLVDGVHVFQTKAFHGRKKLFQDLASGQRPHTLFVTCSDSRIDPALLTQSQPGELFILRNAGNLVPSYMPGSAEAAAIEFAVVVLGVVDIVICGHSHCGAMKAILDPPDPKELPALSQWLEHAEVTRRVVRENYEKLAGLELLSVVIQENVLAQLEQLRTHPVVASRLARGLIALHGWVYQIETGEVFSFDTQERQFRAIADVKGPAVDARALAFDP